MIEITVYGNPVPQGRPQFARIGKYVTTYDPERSKNYKKLVRFWVTKELRNIDGFKPFDKAVCVDLTFYLGIPVSWSKQKRMLAAQDEIRPTGRPDVDNLVKSVTDAVLGLLWVDDSIITDLTARKRYTDGLARVEIRVTEV